MRCKYCGSTLLHEDTQHKTFSTGKAVAGAIVFGVAGTAAGLIGKDHKGYRCGDCGAFMDAPMDYSTEMAVDNAIRDAEAGRGTSLFDYFQKQYPRIQAKIPEKKNTTEAPLTPKALQADRGGDAAIKHMYRNRLWSMSCPVYIETVIIKSSNGGDVLSLTVWNQSSSDIRSAYLQVAVYDDTGDSLGQCQCVYQGLSVRPGASFPTEKEFPLNTDVAYRVEIVCDKVAFTNDEVWRKSDSEDNTILPESVELTAENFPRLKYVRRHIHEISSLDTDSSLYMPTEESGYWQCICGHPVKANSVCPRCGADTEKINKLLSQEYLQQLQQKNVKAIAAERAEATMALYKQVLNRKNEEKYRQAAHLQHMDDEASLKQAAEIYNSISDYKDSAEKAVACRDRIPVLREELRQKRIKEEKAAEVKRIAEEKAEAERKIAVKAAKKRNRKIAIFSAMAAALIIVIAVVLTQVVIPASKYKKAEGLLAVGDFGGAIAAFTDLGDYSDAADRALETQYNNAEALLVAGDYDNAIKAFQAAVANDDNMLQAKYLWAERCLELEEFDLAIDFYSQIGSYNDSAEKIKEAYYLKGCKQFDSGEYGGSIDSFNASDLYRDADERVIVAYYMEADREFLNENYDKAVELFAKASSYSDSKDRLISTYYALGNQLMENKKYEDAVYAFNRCANYEDSVNKSMAAKYGYVLQHQDNQDRTTYQYLFNLVSENYPGAKAIYDELYTLRIEYLGALDHEPDESEYSSDEFTAYDTFLTYRREYLIFRVNGGLPGEQFSFRCEVTWPNGTNASIDENNVKGGQVFCFWITAGQEGTYTLQVYDKDTGALMLTVPVRSVRSR